MTEQTFQKDHQSEAQADDAAVQLEHDFIAIVREEIGMHEALAAIVAQALVRGLRRRNGGQSIWIPAPDKSQRDAAIRREFMGARNLKEIMAKYGISRSRVYQIVGMREPIEVRIGVSSPKNPVPGLQTGRMAE